MMVMLMDWLISDEKVLDGAVRDVIERDLALRAVITRNVELLMFSSRVFPTQDWRKLSRITSTSYRN